jgi:RNA polymerase sigma-70 factor, ECF subfamily
MGKSDGLKTSNSGVGAEQEQRAVDRFLRERTEASFIPLYEAHTPVMLGIATRLARNHAEDAVQEAWIRAVAALPRFRWRSSLRTWLCGIVVNCCRELSRNSASQLTAVDELAPAVTPPVLEQPDVERAIASMPAAAREVFVLHELYGYTHEEIGDIAGIDAGTSRSQLHHSRRMFRAFFGEP